MLDQVFHQVRCVALLSFVFRITKIACWMLNVVLTHCDRADVWLSSFFLKHVLSGTGIWHRRHKWYFVNWSLSLKVQSTVPNPIYNSFQSPPKLVSWLSSQTFVFWVIIILVISLVYTCTSPPTAPTIGSSSRIFSISIVHAGSRTVSESHT